MTLTPKQFISRSKSNFYKLKRCLPFSGACKCPNKLAWAAAAPTMASLQLLVSFKTLNFWSTLLKFHQLCYLVHVWPSSFSMELEIKETLLNCNYWWNRPKGARKEILGRYHWMEWILSQKILRSYLWDCSCLLVFLSPVAQWHRCHPLAGFKSAKPMCVVQRLLKLFTESDNTSCCALRTRTQNGCSTIAFNWKI